MMNPLNIKCKRCTKSFDRGEQMSLYNNNYYHNTCFVCSFCEQSLAGQGFYTKPDGSFQCQRCHTYHTPKCSFCENPIPDGVKYNIYQGKHFHKDCFKCIKCQGMIGEGRSFQETKEGFVCLDCAKITNHGYHGMVYGKDNKQQNFTQPEKSADAHPVNNLCLETAMT